MTNLLLKHRWLIAILVVSSALRLVAAFMMGNTVDALPGIFDQISYSTLATRLISGHGFTFDTQWWPITQAGAPTAHWSYLYTLMLALFYAIFGVNPLVVRIMQAIAVGILMPWLIWRIALRAFNGNSVIALVAAGWTALYAYFIYYAAALMTESLYMVGILWSIDCAQRIVQQRMGSNRRAALMRYLELGLSIAITITIRQVYLLFIPFLFVWIIWCSRDKMNLWKSLRNTAGKLAVSVTVIVLFIAPITAWNYHQFNRFVLLNTNSGYAFFFANHPNYGNNYLIYLPPDMPYYTDWIPAELTSLDEAALDQALLQRGIGFVVADPVRYLRLSISRIPAYFMFWPTEDSGSLSNLMRVISAGFVIPFVLIGLANWLLELRRKREPSQISASNALLLLLFAIIYSGVHIASWAGIRYRLPVDAVMIGFAAYGLTDLYQRLRHNAAPHTDA